jgi:hypothetical protein
MIWLLSSFVDSSNFIGSLLRFFSATLRSKSEMLAAVQAIKPFEKKDE